MSDIDTNTDPNGSYIVLELVSNDLVTDPNSDERIVWMQINEVPVTASNQKSAIEQVVENLHDGGTFLAVPARSYKPMSPKAVTKIEWS